MTQRDKTNSALPRMFLVPGRSVLPLAFTLSLVMSACTSFTRAGPPLQIQPTSTKITLVTPTATETFVPSLTIEMTSSPVATPTEDPNSLTYKNEAGQTVTVQLGKHEHTNKKGEVHELIEVPDENAWVKYYADRLPWVSGGTDPRPLLEGLGTSDDLHALLKQFDVDWPPKQTKNPHTWIGAHPTESHGLPYMVIFVTDLDGGTLAVGRQEDGTLLPLFIDVPTDILDKNLLTTYDGQARSYDYLLELASQHQ